ncbi:MAG: ABC-F family ATP-binding cassette domain-containing protein [Eubacteriales bacterium]|nr:ABC-F family ATP-binding cassette domain-containing protein [Eubacteriales bacterium]
MRISAENISKNYGDRQILSDVTLHITHQSRIGLIGVNGTGKSTLLKILAGAQEPDSGSVTVFPGVQVSYLPQTPEMTPGRTVLEQVLANCPADFRDAHEYEAKTMLTRLGVAEFDRDVATLSGGQRKRAALAAAFLRPAEVLILDEPTNHLDTDMIDWLEGQLRRYSGAIIMVTHDRYFLDRVVNTIAEVSFGKLYLYEANYSGYLQLRALRIESAQASERKRQSILRREYQWITRGAQARTTKSQERIHRYEALLAQDAPELEASLEISAGASRLGKKTLEMQAVCKAFSGKKVVDDFSYTLLRDDRIGVVGRNGAGKSTLLNLIAGLLEPDSGAREVGATVRIGYFRQENEALDPRDKVIEYLNNISPALHTREGVVTASQMLEKFLFPSYMHYNEISRLSGGERRRLYLLGILMSAPNVLLLDEPTNDLDIETLTVLEEYLVTFPGAVIAVSHDRYFLDKIAHSIFEVRRSGEVRVYTGSFADYAAKREPDLSAEEKAESAKPAPAKPAAPKPQKLKFSFKEQREFETIDGDIAALEEAIAQCERDIEANASDYMKLQELSEKKEQLSAQLDEKTERWIYLNDLAERIEAQGKG